MHLKVVFPSKARFKVDAKALAEYVRDEEPTLDTFDDPYGENIAGHVELLCSGAVNAGAIRRPRNLSLYVMNDDGIDICGLVVGVHPRKGFWPIVVDGWADIKNYLPSNEDKPEDPVEHARYIIDNVLSVANAILNQAAPEPEPEREYPDPPEKLADAWRRFQAGEDVAPYELRALDEWRADVHEDFFNEGGA